jgi:glucan 1,4-alpha-glucosidase
MDALKSNSAFLQHGEPFYRTTFNQKLVLDTSYIGGFEFKELSTFSDQFSIIRSESSSANETWDMPWGEQKTVSG